MKWIRPFVRPLGNRDHQTTSYVTSGASPQPPNFLLPSLLPSTVRRHMRDSMPARPLSSVEVVDLP